MPRTPLRLETGSHRPDLREPASNILSVVDLVTCVVTIQRDSRSQVWGMEAEHGVEKFGLGLGGQGLEE